ncbi:MAG: hypothetical protein EZS28_020849 [Streblomastix strix]|uniref:Uncharacterized protein n=1 Tax=Streblomastix strix TaxID=222440 RepID=A0A5J4VLU9_9EUKA|nr:MAG: hypothetical protein EZS28_020849 [Streblomastix strix]
MKNKIFYNLERLHNLDMKQLIISFLKKGQFNQYRIYLASLLVELAGATQDTKLAVATRYEFIELSNIIRWSSEQSKEFARPLQDWVCEAVQNIIDDNPDAILLGSESGIIDELQQLLGEILELDEIKFVHANSLKLFTTYGSDEVQEKMHNMGICKSILKNIQSKNIGVGMDNMNQIFF